MGMKQKKISAKKRTQKPLTLRVYGTKMQDMRQVVRDRMKKLKLTPYAVGRLLENEVTEQTVRNFVIGEHEMRTDKFARLISVLGLEIRPKE